VNICTTSELEAKRLGASPKPRILHVLASLSLGGIETWLMHMLRHSERFSVEHEVLLTKAAAGEYEAEARQLGIMIHRLPMEQSRRVWLESFRTFLMAQGPFAAIHSHVYFFSAPVLAAAKKAGVPARIAHCHTARSRGNDHKTIRHKLRRAIAIRWLKRVATTKIGISEAAIEEIAGADWKSDPSNTVLIYGFDFSQYRAVSERARSLRRQLAIPAGVAVVGHVGRFELVKNHVFLVEAFAAALQRVPNAQLVLVGNGPIEALVAAKVKALGLAEQVHFPGTTDDVAAFMRMFDVFILPSLSEGLGIVCVEAQAAGTPVIVSDKVPAEVEVVPGAVQFLPLSDGVGHWGAAIAQAVQRHQGHFEEWLAQVEQSRFAIGRCIEELDQIYRSELERALAPRLCYSHTLKSMPNSRAKRSLNGRNDSSS
jgi:glycosyltransferase involved in cell wall biosynthesis